MRVERGRLEGGPFDGDAGTIEVGVIPAALYTVACPRGSRCRAAGVHWWPILEPALRDAAATGGDVHTYVYARRDTLELVYVYGDLTEEGFEAVARGAVPLAV